jgi:hypothetical protein
LETWTDALDWVGANVMVDGRSTALGGMPSSTRTFRAVEYADAPICREAAWRPFGTARRSIRTMSVSLE